ncbi:PTS fructose transporter subunit IIC [Vallicoccus soli]|uniref:PTS fructose transporter subunit IIBC n=1 Tax=Vallicoccus soli TaxID=2339232 RepID=A0A3A3ZKC9_9ACTN|nr:PTS fructose transporter subunit IIBC [Vallicoccus soli]RJK96280.1 PTS fructose transporter subunit IIBC [Vallicoccus soli]
MKIVAVTSCPTGIAHTYMAAESLEQSAAAAGHEIHVETQGSAGADPLPQETIDAADVVVFAADVEVRERQRFAGKPTLEIPVKRAISHGPQVIEEAVARAAEAPAPVPAGAPAGAPGPSMATKVTAEGGTLTRVRQWVMTGVSYMIPFVAAGGLLIAIGFMVSGNAREVTSFPLPDVVDGIDWTSRFQIGALLFQLGVAAFAFLLPALGGFIAFAIADRPGIVPGFVGGALAGTVGAGFLGALAAGFIGGFTARWVSRWKVPKALRGIMPVVVIPLVATLVTGLLIVVVLGPPLSAVVEGLGDWLNGLSGANLFLLGALLGAMMAFDLGGPINKVAYTFATTQLGAAAAGGSDTNLKVMAAVMAAGMVPPLAMALASTVLRPALFSHPERENGKTAWVLGASFISEGAIPFAAVDPLRVIASSIVGASLTGGLVMVFGSTLRAPHGGIWVTPLIGGPLLYLVAIAAGTLVSAVLVIALKSARRGNAEIVAEEDAAASGVATARA